MLPVTGVAGKRTGGALGPPPEASRLAILPGLVNAILLSAEFGWSTLTLIAR